MARPTAVQAEAAAHAVPAPAAGAEDSVWDGESWQEVFAEWRWWAGAALALAVLGLVESLAAAPAAASDPGPGGEWLLADLNSLFEGGPLLRSLAAAGLSGALIWLPWLWARRTRAAEALREARRIERSLYASRKKWWPRS